MIDTRTAVLLLSAVLPSACLDHESAATDEVRENSHQVTSNVQWATLVGVQTTGPGNGLVKNGGTNGTWDAGAVSSQTLGRHGYVEFKTGETNLAKAIGLSSGNSGQHISDIDHAMYLRNDGKAYLYENGTSVQFLANYTTSSLLRIEATPTSVRYKMKDGAGVWTTLATRSFPNGVTFPLLVDTSLRDTNATLTNVVVNSAPRVHVAAQDGFIDDSVSLQCGVKDVISVSGRHFLDMNAVDGPTTFHQFSLTPIGDVETKLLEFVDDSDIDPEEQGIIVIIDIENPHLKDLWEKTVSQQSDIVEGFITRIQAAQNVFPNAQIGLYGTLNPHGQGNDTANYENRLARLQWAGDQGLYEEPLDFLVPILYTRFGCDVLNDPDPDVCDAPFNTIDSYTEQGIRDSRLLERIDGTVLPLLPILGFWVDNKGGPEGNTAFDDVLLRDLGVFSGSDPFAGTLKLQMDILTGNDPAYHVNDVVLWKGGCTDEVVRDGLNAGACNTTNDQVIDDYTCWM